MNEHRLKCCIVASVIVACIGFALLQCVPLVNLEGTIEQKIGAYVIAALFWISIIVQIIIIRISTVERRWLERHVRRSRTISGASIGTLSFFKNIEAIIVDSIMFISLITITIELWTGAKIKWLIILSVSILYLSFSLHSIFNGRNYRYLKAIISSKKEHE